MVEIVPQKPKVSLPTWRWPLWLSVALFLLSIVAFIFLRVYLSQIQTEIVDVNNQIKIEAAKVNADDENSIARLSDSFKAFNSMVANHSYFSNVFDMIGSLTYQRVVFTKFDANRETNVIQLRGAAQNYTALAKQMVALRENANVKSLEVKGISFGANGLEFEISAVVNPKLFVKEQPVVPTIPQTPAAAAPTIPETSSVGGTVGSFFSDVWSGVLSLIQSLSDAIGDLIQQFK